MVKLSGEIMKHKPSPPKRNFTYGLHLEDEEIAKKGEIDNLNQMQSLAKKFGLMKVESGKVHWGDRTWKTQKALMEEVAGDPEMYRAMWRSIIKAATGKIV